MKMAEYSRPAGFRFGFGGINLRSTPDALAPNKYAVAQNIRSTSDNSIITRPGYSQTQSGFGSITDIKAYSTLSTDDLPRFLFRNSTNTIILDNGTAVASLAGSAGEGVWMIPFRPSNSPQSWMYVAGVVDYQKLSAPVGGSVTAQKVGIAEPFNNLSIPAPVVGAAPIGPAFKDFTAPSSVSWVASGIAATTSTSSYFGSDTVGVIFADPLISTRHSFTFNSTSTISGLVLPGMELTIGGTAYPVQEVLAACSPATVSALKYYSGSTGLCEMVLSVDVSGVLQRGSIIHIAQGVNSEYLFVNWAVTGPSQTCTIEVSTIAAYTVSGSTNITGIGAVIVDAPISAGNAITSPTVESLLTTTSSATTGGFTQTLTTNPLAGFGPDDLINASLIITNIAAVSTITIALSTNGPGLSFQVTGPSLAPTAVAGEVFNIQFAISSMLGFTGMPGNVTSASISLMLTGPTGTACTVELISLSVSGGSKPDIGVSGTNYMYQVIPRSSLTGAQGNACADMRYGVNPRRQAVMLSLPSAGYDTQIDTWDIYRYGGSLTSYRYLDSIPASATTYIDNTFDSSLNGTQVMPTENFEPWPSVDLPFLPVTPTVLVVGHYITVTASGGFPTSTPSWLPGTLLITSAGTFTLRDRPVGFGSTVRIFEVEENAGSATGSLFNVPEPFVARSFNPYVFGPDAYGTMFGAGDIYRPGFLSFCSSYQPDIVPDTNNIELCPPSEPLLGGAVMNGLAYAASSKRWWGLYPSLSGTPAYQQVEIPVGHPLASPYGLTTNGQMIFFWGQDGIYFHQGGQATSLTDADLYGLFPHDGVLGENVTQFGVTVWAPDYSRAAAFRLSVIKSYLYADYQDGFGVPHTLVCDLRVGAWEVDVYRDPVTVHYAPDQQQGTLLTTGTLYPLAVMGTSTGLYLTQGDFLDDNSNLIQCQVNTFQFDGGDLRATPQWGDSFLDGIFPSATNIASTSLTGTIGLGLIPALSTNRQFLTIPMPTGEQVVKFVGLQVAWVYDTSVTTARTQLFLWQPSVLAQPETTSTRNTDWFDLGGASYVRGVRFTANTFNVAKEIVIRNGDNFTIYPLNVTFNGTQEQAFAFDPPFVAHTIRLEPDGNPWILFPGTVIWDKDKWPELIQEYSPWMNLGTPQAKYLRGVVIPMDTNGALIGIKIVSETGQVFTSALLSTEAAVKTPVAIAISVPMIGHEFQIVPNAPVRIWWEEIQFIFDPWPELINMTSPWLNPGGGAGAKYLLSAVIPLSTEGLPVSLSFLSSDNNVVTTLGPFTTSFGEKFDQPMAFVVPFVCHELRISPSGPCRIWFDAISWQVVPYPELTNAYTPILEYSTPDSVYVQGIKLTCDSSNLPVSFQILYDGGRLGPLIGPFTFNGKETEVTSLVPFIAHNFQLVPNAPVRVFLPECKWVFEPTPENAIQWGPTQWTAHGMTGYQFVGRLEVSYSSTASVTLTITSYDGTSPQAITLPSTGGVTNKLLVTPTFNKGQLYQYTAISASPFQIFLNDWVVWIGKWGRSQTMIPYRNLGGQMGDKAAI